MPTIADILLAARAKQHAGRFHEVESLCREVLAVTPNSAEAHALLAESLVQRDALHEALGHYRQTLCLEPNHVPTHLNLGCMLERSGWIDEAIACYRNGLRIAPNLAQAHQHLGRALCEQHRTDEAIACFQRALALKPGWPAARLGRAHAWLMQGDLGRGWDEYECRDAAQPGTWQPCTLPRWDGSRPTDKTLLVFAEQGLGTELLFASCIPDVAHDVGHAILQCDPRLGRLFSRSFPEVTVLAKLCGDGGFAPPCGADLHIPLGSLPRIYRRCDSDFPRRRQYLVPDPALRAEWAARLARLGGGPKIGISWRGGNSTEKMLRRSAPLDEWLPVLRVPHANWVNVQYGPCHALLRKMADHYDVTIHDWDDLDQTRDMESMAALLSQLDLVISVNNSAVHLAAAVGRPVWLLLPLGSDWRWMVRRVDSPWHPSVRLFRQTTRREWANIFGPLHAKLTRLVEGNRDAA